MTRSFSGGWYELEVFSISEYGYEQNSIKLKFGVGEVIFIAGQSNAQGTNESQVPATNVTTSYYDCVNIVNEPFYCQDKTPNFPNFSRISTISKIAPNGTSGPWAYAYLGKRVVDNYNLPVMFINTGASGTSISNWEATALDQNVTVNNTPQGGQIHCNSTVTMDAVPNGQPYVALKNSLNYWGSMFGARTVLWHQGETDNIENTSSGNYTQKLNTVISRSRDYFNSTLNWAVSRVSYYQGNPDSGVTTGQSNTVSVSNNVNKAAYFSDNITSYGRQMDNIHFNTTGLKEVGDQYYNELANIFSKPSVSPNMIPNISVTNNITTRTFTAPSGYSYCWVSGNGSMKRDRLGNVTGCHKITQSITESFGSYRCYVYSEVGSSTGTNTSNIRLSQKVFANNSVNSGYRIAANKTPVETSAYPNPFIEDVNITFELPYDAKVKVEILDRSGRVLKEIADSIHDKGEYTYPVKIKSKSEFYYYRVTVDDESITKKLLKE